MNSFSFAVKMLKRDLRTDEIRILVIALILAVAAITSSGFFTDRIRQGLSSEGARMLGADLVISADHALDDSWRRTARDYRLQSTLIFQFPSMVAAATPDSQGVQMAEIKAVSAGYPFKGELKIRPVSNGSEVGARSVIKDGVPAPGTVWLDVQLAGALRLLVGDLINVGNTQLKVGAILTSEPDRGINFLNVAPRLMMNARDVARTELIQAGSRVRYRLLLSGEGRDVARFRAYAQRHLDRGEQLEEVASARPELRNALEKTENVLGLVVSLTAVLAGVAIFMTVRHYVERHKDTCAVMKCLGVTSIKLLNIYTFQLLILGVVSSLLGAAIGFVGHFPLFWLIGESVSTSDVMPSLRPAWYGLASGLVLLLTLALPNIYRLGGVPALKVFRRETTSGIGTYSYVASALGVALMGLAGVVYLITQDFRWAGSFFAGSIFLALMFLMMAKISVAVACSIARSLAAQMGGFSSGVRYGLAQLTRKNFSVLIQIAALSVGMMVLLLATVVTQNLLLSWRQSLPADAPNNFVINIQPEQLASVKTFFLQNQFDAEFSPMIRGRLIAINARAVSARDYEDERTKRLVEREFNLSYRESLPSGNSISDGHWFLADEMNQSVATVEQGLAERVGIKLNDTLEFNVAGENVNVKVVGIRKLEWTSMRVNFFVLTAPNVLENRSASWITSFHLPSEQQSFKSALVNAFPNLTVIDVSQILLQIQTLFTRASKALQYLLMFTLAAGVIVLYAVTYGSAHARRQEIAVLRSLGATRKQLWQAFLIEFSFIGGIAGAIAVIGANLVGWALASYFLHVRYEISFGLSFISVLAGVAISIAAVWRAVAFLVKTPPMEALKAYA